jgi:anti-sigma factor RsiW
MRCEAVRQVVEDGLNRPPAVEVHVKSCSACREYVRQWEMIRAGLVALRGEEPPEPSIGFTTRVMRRLENGSAELPFGQQFIDQIGRQVVYATLMVAVMLFLILALPSSGPLRSTGISESILVQAQVATLSNEPVLGVDGMDDSDSTDSSPASAPISSPAPRGPK